MSFNPSFKYPVLPTPTSIRVLIIHPGEPDDSTHCRFLPCDLDADPARHPDSPRPVEATQVVKDRRTGQVFPLSCDTLASRLHPFQRYRALSYVWGATTELQTIHLEDEAFLVTRNLLAALKVLRNPRGGVVLWADAICINQADLVEKETQIPLMGRVYQQAESVWGQVLPSFDKGEDLGNLMDAIRTAGLRLEKDLWERLEREYGADQSSTEGGEGSSQDALNLAGSRLPVILTEYALEDYNLPSSDSPLWQSWREFFASPYFRRIWIQQEMMLAKEFHWLVGDNLLHPEALFDCVCTMIKYSREIVAAYLGPGLEVRDDTGLSTADIGETNEVASGFLAAKRMLFERDTIQGDHKRRRLVELLDDYREFCATEARDMVFGLLGLADDADAFYDLVDYKSSTEQVFLSLAQRLVELGHGVQLLSQASNTEANDELPSWVPVG